ncbi:hypothetical protein B0H19DRAFT_1260133 [Mycena capillaripes]|nr:hypothetical protein B0H19DRAFT_1260133 [Mycena capillaripes]
MEPPTYDGFNDEALLTSSHGDQQSELPTYTRRPTPPPTAQVDRTPKEFRLVVLGIDTTQL